ncbi:MAG: ZIP family metal transporter [Bacillales bacterium]|nr:ZIP family metal transporter [Bacillales bacterium]
MNHTLLTILGIAFIFIMTTLGSALIYVFRKKISEKTNTIFLGFASGIMIAASIWSLIIPSIEESSSLGSFAFVPAAVGIILGALFLVLLDKVVPHMHGGTKLIEGPNVSIKKTTKLFLAITIHNIPEGLAVGFAFGVAFSIGTDLAYISALGLALGIGIQNFPEGAAVSLPMYTETGSKNKSFLYGTLSGAVEPIFAVLGFFLAAKIEMLQPWLLSFAAGAMLFVVIEDLLPDARIDEHPHLGTWSMIAGFIVMMILDVALG